MNISGIFILFAHWSDCVDRNDEVFITLLYKIVIHRIKKCHTLMKFRIPATTCINKVVLS